MPSRHQTSQHRRPRLTERNKVFIRQLLKYIDDRVEGNAVLKLGSPGGEGTHALQANPPNRLIHDPRLANARFSHHNDESWLCFGCGQLCVKKLQLGLSTNEGSIAAGDTSVVSRMATLLGLMAQLGGRRLWEPRLSVGSFPLVGETRNCSGDLVGTIDHNELANRVPQKKLIWLAGHDRHG